MRIDERNALFGYLGFEIGIIFGHGGILQPGVSRLQYPLALNFPRCPDEVHAMRVKEGVPITLLVMLPVTKIIRHYVHALAEDIRAELSNLTGRARLVLVERVEVRENI